MIYFPKSQPAPESLEIEKSKANGDYKQPEVLERLQADFKNKCYLCEDKDITSINVEYFKPHRENKDLKFDWDNLFFACVHCNSTKSDKYEDILNCTVEEDGVDTKIRYYMNPFPKELVLIDTIESNPKIEMTALLLNNLYNGTTILKRIESNNLRRRILQEIYHFNSLLDDYFDSDSPVKVVIKNKVLEELTNSSSFTAFKRWIIKDNPKYLEEFGQFV